MNPQPDLPAAVDTRALSALSKEHHERATRFLGAQDLGGHLAKVYTLTAPRRSVTAPGEDAAMDIAQGHLSLGAYRGSLGLAVVIVHAGADGDHVLVHSWLEDHMSDLAVYTGRAGRSELLRPGRTGRAPCVWEARILAHERDAFTARILDGRGDTAARITAWSQDAFEGGCR
ncbi:hypothetical protein O4J56_31995 [Nocardiopsis sp. RSe5-2]|uniref:Uncharacterized protein n=1 Tax=Nocardiopsis endophytica TaxID=3018445 RepID=A0ABT4UED4_9ACTN|nr:hypothetical protein [Nocardiopsis endophytica]MDA2815308.1 hypothetical protein [Nocardiopsis endophytica]